MVIKKNDNIHKSWYDDYANYYIMILDDAVLLH